MVTSEDDGSEVSFKIGKKSNIEAGIVDWRNGPISGLFFNYKQGEEFFETINERDRCGQIKIRRTYKTDNGILINKEENYQLFKDWYLTKKTETQEDDLQKLRAIKQQYNNAMIENKLLHEN